jgi:predicted HD phosphohydrolase
VKPTKWAQIDAFWQKCAGLIERVGKQHIGLARCLSQDIGKLIVEFANKSIKQAADAATKMRMIAAEVHRKQDACTKSIRKYVKAVEDAETAIAARDKAIQDSTIPTEENPENFLAKVRYTTTRSH